MDYEEISATRKRKVTFSIYMPMPLVDVIDRIADAEERSPAAVFERLVRKGMAVEREERRVAQGA